MLHVTCNTGVLYGIASYAVEPIELETLLQNPMIFSQSLLPSGELVASSIQGKITVSPDITWDISISGTVVHYFPKTFPRPTSPRT